MKKGMLPDCPEDGYGWIMPGEEEKNREAHVVQGFWEKPTRSRAQELWEQGAWWNTFVCVAQSGTLWSLARRAVSEVSERWREIRRALGTPSGEKVTEEVYTTMPAVNVCLGLCEPLAAEVRVLPVSAGGWSDWGMADRIWAMVKQLGKQAEFLTRLNQRRGNWAPPTALRV